VKHPWEKPRADKPHLYSLGGEWWYEPGNAAGHSFHKAYHIRNRNRAARLFCLGTDLTHTPSQEGPKGPHGTQRK
jgi:hypothetical protein